MEKRPVTLRLMNDMITEISGDMDRKAEDSRNLLRETLDSMMRGYRNKLDSAGFVVIESIFDIEGSGDISGYEDIEGDGEKFGEEVRKFFDYWDLLSPSMERMSSKDPKWTEKELKMWTTIRDKATGGKTLGKDARLMSSTHASGRNLEDMGPRGWEILKTRCKLEVLIFSVVKWLKLRNSDFDTVAENCAELVCPDTGGRMIGNGGAEARRQIAHTDYMSQQGVLINRKDGSLQYPPYFAMVSGAEEVMLWVAEGSQRYVACDVEVKKLIAKGVKLRLIRIRPWSMIICRGDLVHAGAGTTKGRRCWRFHVYIIRTDVAFGDVINHFQAGMFKHQVEDENEDCAVFARSM